VRWERRRLTVQTEEARASTEEVDGEGWGVAGTEKAGLVTRLGGGREVVQTEEAGVRRRWWQKEEAGEPFLWPGGAAVRLARGGWIREEGLREMTRQ
jgi:hypothetical protein